MHFAALQSYSVHFKFALVHFKPVSATGPHNFLGTSRILHAFCSRSPSFLGYQSHFRPVSAPGPFQKQGTNCTFTLFLHPVPFISRVPVALLVCFRTRFPSFLGYQSHFRPVSAPGPIRFFGTWSVFGVFLHPVLEKRGGGKRGLGFYGNEMRVRYEDEG